ncbi:MAG: putative metalloprotease CJM1_0395 family protein [Desulfobacteraceae bacterium]
MNINTSIYGSQIAGSGFYPAVSHPGSEKATAPDNSSKNSDNAQNPEQKVSLSAEASLKLSEQELRLIQELKKTDAAVRRHEMAHIAAGGRYITSGARLEYKKGPDGRNYAVAGEVSIDTSPVPGDPEATAEKMRKVRQAALAPVDPSSQDRAVAAKASAQAIKASAELMALRTKQNKSDDSGLDPFKSGTQAYARVTSPDPETGKNLNISV